MNTASMVTQQSAVIPYRKRKGRIEIALITSSSRTGWVFPKGLIERDLTPEESAAKEALEEAGILGKVIPTVIEEYEYEKWGGLCHVKVYPMKITQVRDAWEEMDERVRMFVPLKDAIDQVKPVQKSSLKKFRKWLKKKSR